MKLILRPRKTRWQIDTQAHQQAFQALTGATSATTDQARALKTLGCPLETVIDQGKNQSKIEL